MDNLDQLAERIEAEHREARHALDVLRRYLSRQRGERRPAGGNGTTPPTPPRQRDQGAKSYSELVLAIITGRWATAEEIAEETGINLRRVRGVLNAPRITKRLHRRRADGRVHYRLREASEGERPSSE